MNSRPPGDSPRPRFLTLGQVSEIINTSNAQVYALVRSGSLRAIKIGGRGQWRIGSRDLEDYIEQAYRDTAKFVASHPFGAGGDATGDDRGGMPKEVDDDPFLNEA